MAKVQYGGGITAITGSIGGWAFHRNRSGNIVRIRGASRKSSTPKQTLAHQSHSKFLQLWQGLRAINQDTWNTFADTFTKTDRFGTVKTLTGQNWFETINFYRDLLSLSILNSPPVHDLPEAVQDYNYAVRSFDILVNFSPPFDPTDNALLIFTTPLNTRVSSSQRQFMRLTKIIDSGPFGFIDITSDWKTTHNISWPPSGSPICGRVAIMIQTIKKSSGIISPALLKTNTVRTDQEGIGFMSIGNDFIIKLNSLFDPDVQIGIDAVFAAGGSLTFEEQIAINVYVLDAKNNANAWWSDTIAEYPMVGGSAASCSINFKNPGIFDIIFINTLPGDFTSNGWQSNGSTSYGRTNIRPDPHTILNSIALEFYSRTDSIGNTEWGAITVASTQILLAQVIGEGSGVYFFDCYNSTTGRISGGAPVNSLGSHLFNRFSATDSKIYINGIPEINITTSGGTRPTHELYLEARNIIGVAGSFDDKECAGAGCFNGLTSLQSLAQYTARQTLNTTLSRQV